MKWAQRWIKWPRERAEDLGLSPFLPLCGLGRGKHLTTGRGILTFILESS